MSERVMCFKAANLAIRRAIRECGIDQRHSGGRSYGVERRWLEHIAKAEKPERTP